MNVNVLLSTYGVNSFSIFVIFMLFYVLQEELSIVTKGGVVCINAVVESVWFTYVANSLSWIYLMVWLVLCIEFLISKVTSRELNEYISLERAACAGVVNGREACASRVLACQWSHLMDREVVWSHLSLSANFHNLHILYPIFLQLLPFLSLSFLIFSFLFSSPCFFHLLFY